VWRNANDYQDTYCREIDLATGCTILARCGAKVTSLSPHGL
jgi:hypothetical protein